jgi:two-component system response regulator AlgR
LRVLVVDDEAPARARLRRLIDGLGEHEIVAEAGDGAAAIREAHAHAPDVALLDVRMPGTDGLEAAHHMAAMEPPPAIVFSTAYSDHALEAFEAHAVDYLVKPVRQDRLAQALASAQRTTRAQLSAIDGGAGPRTQICAQLGGEMQLVAITDVLYFRAEHKYVTVRHREGEVLIEESLKSLERELGDRFLRIHRSALAAEAWLGGLRRDARGHHVVSFKGVDDTLAVSRRHLPAVRRRLRTGNLSTP